MSRAARAFASVLLGLEAAVLLLSLPLVLFMVLASGWEGGDQAAKHRLQDWGLLSLPVGLVAVVLLGVAVVSVTRERPSRGLLAAAVGAVLVLAAGWAYVWAGDMARPGILGMWLALTLVPVVAVALVRRSLTAA